MSGKNTKKGEEKLFIITDLNGDHQVVDAFTFDIKGISSGSKVQECIVVNTSEVVTRKELVLID